MPQAVPIFTAIGALAGAGSAISGLVQQGSAKKAAKSANSDQSRLANDIYGQRASESDQNGIAARDAARNRAKALALGAQGRRSTILTSPLGVVGESANGGLKTATGQ